MLEPITVFFSNISLSEYISAFFAFVSGIASIFGINGAKKVKKDMINMIEMQRYNKTRRKIATEIENCIIFLADENMSITLTHTSNMQSCVQQLKGYTTIFKKQDMKKLDKLLDFFKKNSYTSNERTDMLEYFNYFLAEIKKGDQYI